MNDLDLSKPILLYGSNISYFTGKMENYFRVKEISYEQKVLNYPKFERTMKEKVGINQMPAVELPDGRWMTDTTKMIQWFESKIPENKIIPEDPVQAFFAFLLEDWADEWWWRTAMHYRWHYSEGAHFASRHLAEELLSSVPLPIWMKKIFLTRRQRNGYTTGEQRRDFVYVNDTIDIKLWFMKNKHSGIFNVATGKSRSFNDVANSVINYFKSGHIEYIDFPEGLEDQYQAFTEADMSNLRNIGYYKKSTELENGVSSYLSFLDKN